MKKILLAAMVLGLAMNVQAQFTGGAEVGMNFAGMSTTQDGKQVVETHTKLRGRVGLVGSYAFSKNFFFETGVYYARKGMYLTDSYTSQYQVTSVKITYTMDYLEIPLHLGARVALGKAGSLLFTGGMYAGWSYTGTVIGQLFYGKYMADKQVIDMTFGSDAAKGDLKSIDYGLSGGVQYRSPIGFYARAQYMRGLANLSNYPGETLRNKNMVLSIGYSFKYNAKNSKVKI